MPGDSGLADRQTAESRIEAIGQRIAVLQAQASGLTARAIGAQERSREVRTVAPAGCSHAAEVAAMQQTLADLEQEIAGLHSAMLTRGTIEQAKGMLMLHRHCDEDAAFDMLVQLSQNSHRKLVDVAATLVATWSSEDHAAS